MIVVTGALGFIGSCVVADFASQGLSDKIVAVDDWSQTRKLANIPATLYSQKVERDNLDQWLSDNRNEVELIVHLGARTDTTEPDRELFNRLNLDYSKMVWRHAVDAQIRLMYASSAATYGLGEHGYIDSHDIVPKLEPLNEYGWSKQWFDQWVLSQKTTPPFWAGLKFFNVYGPNEYHKSRMASVIFHTYHQVQKTGAMKLFRSHKEGIADGHQSRDFIYVKDLVSIIKFLKDDHTVESGLYNLGTGTARSFLDLAKATFKAMNVEENISFVDTPADIRDKYQYFTEADMTKLKNAGYNNGFYSLEDGILDYVKEYLIKNTYY